MEDSLDLKFTSRSIPILRSRERRRSLRFFLFALPERFLVRVGVSSFVQQPISALSHSITPHRSLTLSGRPTWPELGLFYRRVSVFMGNYARETAE